MLRLHNPFQENQTTVCESWDT